MRNKGIVYLFLGALFIMNSAIAESRSFQLKDFSGEWIFHSTSVGGLGTESGPGVTSAVLRKINIDTKGIGIESNGTFVFYGSDGVLKEYKEVSGEIITVNLTDPVNGAGTITVQDSTSFKATSEYNFLAIRNRSGIVTKIQLIMVSTTSSSNKVVVTGVAERQLQN